MWAQEELSKESNKESNSGDNEKDRKAKEGKFGKDEKRRSETVGEEKGR